MYEFRFIKAISNIFFQTFRYLSKFILVTSDMNFNKNNRALEIVRVRECVADNIFC
jgi:hypothetical protein